jgi:hypothetical protein
MALSPNPTTPWMRSSEAEAYLRLAEGTLRSQRSRGGTTAPYHRVGVKTIRYNRMELDAWLFGAAATS